MKILSGIFLVAILSCSSKDNVPEDILPRQKMTEVMWDMMRAGEFLNSFVFFKDTQTNRSAQSQKWYSKIYRIHGLTKEEFERSYDYYQHHPHLMKIILDSLSRSQVTTSTPYSPTKSVSKDSSIKTPGLGSPSIDTRIKIADSTMRERILRKKDQTQ